MVLKHPRTERRHRLTILEGKKVVVPLVIVTVTLSFLVVGSRGVKPSVTSVRNNSPLGPVRNVKVECNPGVTRDTVVCTTTVVHVRPPVT